MGTLTICPAHEGTRWKRCPVFNVGLPQKTFALVQGAYANNDVFMTPMHREILQKRLRAALPTLDGPGAYGGYLKTTEYRGLQNHLEKIPENLFTLDVIQNGLCLFLI